MNIHTKERHSTITVLILSSIVAIIIWWNYGEVKEANSQLQQANKIARGVSDLRLATIDYLMRRQEPARVQWHTVSDHVDYVIADNQLTESEQKKILADLREKKAMAQSIFEQLTLPLTFNGLVEHDELKRRHEAQLFDQLVLNQRDSVTAVFRLTDLAAKRVNSAQQRMMILALLGLFLIAVVKVATSWLVKRYELAPIDRMKRAMQEVAAGKWNFEAGRGSAGVDKHEQVNIVFEDDDCDLAHSQAALAQFQSVTALHPQQVLRPNEQTLRHALDAAQIGHWNLDLVTREARSSLRNDQIFGYEEAVDWTYDIFLTHVLAEDRERVDQLFQAGVAAKTDWDFECRITRCDGALRWIWAHGNVFTDEAGEPVRMLGIVSDITERKQAELALRESEARFRRVIESDLIGMIFWNAAGEITSANDAFLRIVGYSQDDLRAGRVDWRNMTPPEYQAQDDQALREVAATGVCAPYEKAYLHQDGSPVPILIGGATLPGGPDQGIAFVLDITQRKQAEAAQRESESRYRLLVQNSPYCIHEIDLEGRLTSMNRAGLEMMCVQDEAEIHGMRYLDTVADDDRERISRLLDLALQGQPAEFEFVAANNLKFQSFFVPIMDEKGAVQKLMGMTLDITERKQAEAEIEHLAFNDALTNLPNRTALQLRLGQAIQHAQAHSRTMALLLMDLNNFREINDTLGHQNGDQVLIQVADRLRRTIRDTDMLVRLGGDEFAVLLPRLADKGHIKVVLNKIMGALNPAFMIEGVALDVQTSIGIALYPDHGQDADTLLRHADVALYNAKDRNLTHLLYDSKSDHYNPQQLVLMAELRLALQRDELVLHYQPVVDIKSGKTVGVEALVRWQHPSRGLLYPDTFIPAAEKTGLIASLTTWVLANALRQQHRWHRAGIDLNVSVNLSVRNLLQADIVVEIRDMLLSSGVQPENLTLEITESAIMVDPGRAKAVLTELHELGVRFAIDDFGIGHSSLAYLRHLPVDKLKVDKSFIMDSTSAANAAIVRATIGLAHSLGLTVTAEGVEDDQTLSALKLLGCEHAQGYYMSRPQAVDKLGVWLRESPWGLSEMVA